MIGAHDQPQTVVVSNVTARPIAIDALSVSDNFLHTTTCGNLLPANSECSVAVTFAPATAGALSGTLTVRLAGVPYTVQLSGSAPVEATISANTTAATVGEPLTLTWSSSAGATCDAQSDVPGSPWIGNITSSGTRTFTESTAASIAYSIRCGVSGAAGDASAATSVTWSWPPVEVTLSATPTTIEVGQSTSITWRSSGATECSASGEGSGDGWSGAKPTAGTQSVTESGPSTQVTFTLSCRSSISGLSKSASVTVAQNVPVKSDAGSGSEPGSGSSSGSGSGTGPGSGSGGGGAMDLVSLVVGSTAVLATASTGWLGWQDSNLRMAGIKTWCVPPIDQQVTDFSEAEEYPPLPSNTPRWH